MKAMIFTLVGKDQPGLISNLAQTVYNMGGNWLGSNLSHMAGHFAGFVHIDLPENKHTDLVKVFNQHPQLKIHLLAGEEIAEQSKQTAKIAIMGNDRAGIVQELTTILNQFRLNIVKFDSCCESAPNWGGLLFKATTIISIDADFNLEELRESLESVANDLMVDIET
ncbi:glycine cleavage system protein R [Paraglaciecola sp. L3A3]|uniref:glycine cleavage system protein R n=1 Tax=Paraglaciecola sp. L3A3 TaxID=2686358 RepID=UPI00131BEAC6|nr:ACT domain-containing protein [Paraglaciecola sp. L3A3]